jgi:septal ring factor EnvC (AmiA/AmiB activator)
MPRFSSNLITGSFGSLLARPAVAAGLMFWRRAWPKRVQAWDKEWRKKVARLENQLADSRKSEEQLEASRTDAQQRVADLESANSELQAELQRLKRAGKTLAQQQQALENSKTVLELHVQAHTRDLQTLQRRYEHILNSAGEGICGLDSTIDPADKLLG